MTSQDIFSGQDYLVQLRKQLKGFSPREQTVILEEIASHIESGQGDPSLGGDSTERQCRLLKELGSPELMGKKMKQVHRPNRLLDLLLVLIPALVFIPLVSMIIGQPNDYSTQDPHLFWSLRGVIAIGGLMLLIGWLRRSDILLIYWSSDVLLRLLHLMLREERFVIGQEAIPNSAIESLVWWLILVGLAILFFRLLWRNRTDLALVMFGLLPILMAASNMGANAWVETHTAAFALALPDWLYRLSRVIEVAWLALFFLSPRRELRWLALELEALNASMMNIFAYLPDQPYIAPAALIPPVFVVLVWWLDRRNQPQAGLRTS